MVFQTKRGSSPLRRRLGARSLIAVSLCVALASVGGASIATGAPVAQVAASPLKIAKKALRIARGANKRSIKALNVANQALSQSGQAGPKGDKGDKGDPGDPGADGKTVLSGTAAPTGADGTDGDFYIRTTTNQIFGPKAGGAWPAPVDLVGPQGPAGEPWTAGGTLPPGETETGVWQWGSTGDGTYEGLTSSVSWSIPLAAVPTGHFNDKGFDGGGAGDCPGTAANPTAAPGHLCVYTIDTLSTNPLAPQVPEFLDTRKEGAVLNWLGKLISGSPEVAWGTFAVTAP